MAGTRNRNTPGDYKLEQNNNTGIITYNTYKNSAYGAPQQSNFAGDGLLMGRITADQLSNNYCDIESQLFGIGSTNLVMPKGETIPDIRKHQSLSIIDRLPLVVPQPLVVEGNQRPYPT